MIPQLKKQANLTGIGAGAVCTLPLPADKVHHGLMLVCRKAAGAAMSRAEVIADVGDVVIRLGGDIKIEASATFLLDMFKYWHDKEGAFTIAGALPILYTRPNLISAPERALMAWGMKNVESYTIEVNITAVATLVTIEVWTLIEDATRNLGRHLCISRHPQTFAATGVQQLVTLPFGDSDIAILADHIGESTGDINSVIVKAGGNDIIDEVPMELNNMMLRHAGRTAQTDYFHLDYSVINDKAGFLPSGRLSSLRYDVEWEAGGGAPGNYLVHREEIRGLISQPIK